MENPDYLFSQLILYYGNKKSLLGLIAEGVGTACARLKKSKVTFLDAFSGSGVVSRFMKRRASLLIANDQEPYTSVVSNCFLANKSDVDVSVISELVDLLEQRKLDPELPAGFISRLYAPADDSNVQPNERLFFTTQNARILDNLRRMISSEVPPELQHFLIAPLLAEVGRRANTPGHFGGFYKDPQTGLGKVGGGTVNKMFLKRILEPICLRAPVFSNYSCDYIVHCRDIFDLMGELDKVDVVYFDPPYTKLPYGEVYFLLNVIVDYIEPENLTRVSGRPKGWNRSDFNLPDSVEDAFTRLIAGVNASFVLLSYNNEGLLPHAQIMSILGRHGSVSCIEQSYKRYVGGKKTKKKGGSVVERLYILEKN